MPLLKVNSLTKRFGGLTAVDNVSIEVKQGEIVSIIGPNGAGKTTFFNMLTGIYVPTEGMIQFQGESIEGTLPDEIINKGIARTFQNIRLFKGMRVLENVMIGKHTQLKTDFISTVFRTKKHKAMEKDMIREAYRLLETVNLHEKASEYADNLAYGDQRKLEIVRALGANPKLILLDEPAAGMNPQETQELMDYIKNLKKDGFTVLLIEHDMKLVMNISDRIYVLDHGALIAEGDSSEIQRNSKVIEAYLGRSVD